VIPILCRNGLVRNFPLLLNPEQEPRMEKILPHPILPRFFDTPKEEKRYIDRLTIRGIQVMSDENSEDNPRWRGDHTYSAEAAQYSLTNFIEPEVAKSHPDWTHDQVRGYALETFESRLRQDRSFEKKESAHEESSVIWQPIQTENGWELATVYGDTTVTLSELWEHTREFAAFVGNPDAYNAEEHATQLRMQEAFISGEATGFVSVLSHPDTVRYVQLWQKNDDGGIVSKHIDLHKTTGRDFTHEEGDQLIQHLQALNERDTTQRTSYAHFFVREQSVHENDIRTVALAQTIEVNADTAVHSLPFVPRLMADVGRQTLRDTSESMVTLGLYLREHVERRIASFRERISKSHEVYTTKNVSRKDTETKQMKGPHGENPMLSVLAEWWVTRSMAEEAEYIPVAAVATIAWITRLDHKHEYVTENNLTVPSHNDHKQVRYMMQKPENEKREQGNSAPGLQRFAERLMELAKKPFNEVLTLFSIDKTHGLTQPYTKVDESKKYPDVLLRVFRLFKFDALRARKQKSAKREVSLTQELTLPRKKAENGVLPPESRDDRVLATHQNREPLTTAFFIWWIIRGFKSDEQSPVDHEHSRESRHEVSEVALPPWVLLSIIWYLASLREAGKPKNTRKKKKARSLLWHHITLRFVIE